MPPKYEINRQKGSHHFEEVSITLTLTESIWKNQWPHNLSKWNKTAQIEGYGVKKKSQTPPPPKKKKKTNKKKKTKKKHNRWQSGRVGQVTRNTGIFFF